jgi:GntR family transcriptional regulator
VTRPLYTEVYEALKRQIATDGTKRTTALPSEASLSQTFGVSLITVRRALQELELDGLIERRQGKGSFIREQPQKAAISMSSFTSDVADGRLRIVRTLVSDKTVPAPPDVARRLAVPSDSLLRHLVRVDSEGGVPLDMDEVYIPPMLAAGITHEIAASPLFMHLWQGAMGITFVRTEYDITVEMPGQRYQELLQIDSATPLLVTGELVFGSSGMPSAWIISRYRGDRSHLQGTVTLVQKLTGEGVIGE